MNAVDGQSMNVIRKAWLLDPTGLTIDFVADRVFWADKKRLQIQWSDFHGRNLGEMGIAHKNFLPQHLQIYQGTLYWSGNDVVGNHGAIFKVGITLSDFNNECPATMRGQLAGNFSRLTGFAVHDSQGKLRAKSHTGVSDGYANCYGSAVALSGPGFT